MNYWTCKCKVEHYDYKHCTTCLESSPINFQMSCLANLPYTMIYIGQFVESKMHTGYISALVLDEINSLWITIKWANKTTHTLRWEDAIYIHPLKNSVMVR